jgi:hypothetical protein
MANNFSGIVNVKDFGAAGDGATPDADAIQQALNAAPPGGALVLFPPGRYVIDKTLNIADKAFAIQGCGPDLSRIVYIGTTLALSFSSQDILNSFTVRDITFEAGNSSAASGQALQIHYPTNPSFSGKTVTIENVEISSNVTGFALPCWDIGISMKNAWNAKISKCYIRGKANSTDSKYGIYLGENCTGVKMDQTNVQWFDQGIWLDTRIEGLTIEQSDITNCMYGIRNTNPSGALHISVLNTHINCKRRCIYFTKVDQPFLCANNFYITESPDVPVLVELVNSSFPKVVACHFFSEGPTPTAAHLVFDGSAFGIVANNTFEGLHDNPAVWLKSSTWNCFVLDNIVVAQGATLVNQYLDEGQGNYIRSMY